MVQEEFARKMAEAQARIEKAKKDMREWRKQYIEENAPYKVGDKVKIVTPAEPRWHKEEETVFAFIKSIEVSDDGTFTPELNAVKKDGTEHKNKRVWISWYRKPTVTLVEQ